MAGMSLGDAVRLNAKQNPKKIAFACAGRTVTFSNYAERCYRLANALLARGLKPGDRLGILSSNRIEFMEAYGAAWIGGFIAVPMNYRLAGSDINYMMQNAGASMLIAEDKYLSLADGLEDVAIFSFASDGEPGSGYERLLEGASKEDPRIPVAADDIAYMFYTGGTTGKPKGVLLDHAGQIANSTTVLIEGSVTPDDTLLTVMPLYHIGGKNFATAHFQRGCTSVLMPAFDPAELLRLIQAEQVRCVLLAPTMIKMLVDHLEGQPVPKLGLKNIYYSSAPMPVALLRKAISLFGKVFMQFYGLTEVGPSATILRKEDHQPDGSPEAQALLAAAGRPMFYVDVEVADENGHTLPAGQVGEIRIRSGALMRGYWNNRAATEETLRDGWIYSGDLGMFNEDGILFVVGRKKEVIKSGGESVYPREIEEILNSHPDIQEAAVVGVPDEKWGESVKAVVVTRRPDALTEAEVIDYCKANLAGFKKPRSVDFWPALPRSPLGKVLKDDIKARFFPTPNR